MVAQDTANAAPRALSIAGSDPSGGAGIQADLKTFAALGAYGMAALTALTAQNTRGVAGVSEVDAGFVGEQIDAVFADIRVDAVKIGMLGSADTVAAVAECLRRHRPGVVVLDPVMVAQSGHRLVGDATVAAMRSELLPLATVITPNLPEAAVLLDADQADHRAAMERVAAELVGLGCNAVVLKGGHLGGAASPDVFHGPEGTAWLDGARIRTQNTHGTGCTLASAIAALAPVAGSLEEAARGAKLYLTRALARASELDVGGGHGPVHHFHDSWDHAPAARVLHAVRHERAQEGAASGG